MSRTAQLLVAGLLVAGLLAMATRASAQATTAQPVRSGQVLVPERPTVTDASAVNAANTPAKPALPAAVQARVDRFKLDARAYLARQEEIKKQMQGANDEERAALRDQLRVLRQQALEQARELRQQTQERAPQLEQKLQDHKELLDEIKSSARDSRPQAGPTSGSSPRRGTD